MNVRIVLSALVALGCAAGGYALGRASARPPPEPTAPPAASGKVVARWSGGSLTADQLRERVLAQKTAAGLQSLDAPNGKSFADAAIRAALLAAEARRMGLESDPKVSGETLEVLSKRLIELQFEDPKKRPAPEEAAVKAWYEQHRSDFVRPERIRLSAVVVPAAAGDKAARKKKQQELEGFRKQLLAMSPSAATAAFDARAKTEKSSGDLGNLSRAELEARLGAETAGQVWLMVGVGQLSPVVQSDEGLLLLRLTSREGALDVPLEQARPQIESRLWYERRDEELNKFVANLGAKHGLVIDQVELKAVLGELR